ncbi:MULTISPECIES: DUF4232 domain-containing protein [Streptomyces]|uniref:DUF4232 domain-containing protein n=1 Tax=Streptomyces sviceus (strain ATCC 29083 / DSM 924 / JCM 4929 / NBRC 13980 / NCIMB 11184 / NRRL 5439 / UC 5370) TaxID=463191 RepID=B5HXZ7_STRX2|nr:MULTISPECIES: DUF4232 domain-containing protein [Streptomyces]EDY57702.2 conserved hypothetical protein [Streptomyces sviceus ATCC 29083]MYT07230.1 DUF4232 domain-containing protein [Streptomyces sp. SID5470]
MSSISRTRLLAAAATTVVAALSLTACNDGTGTQDEGRVADTSRSAAASHSPAPSAATDQSPSTDSTGSSAGTGSYGAGAGSTGGTATSARRTPVSKAPSSSGGPVTCEGSTVRTVAAPLTRPVNHMLLTVTNTGSKSCYLYGYPVVRFGEAQAVPPVIEASQPQAVVTLAPGESGYASVNLAATDGSGANGYTAKTLTVYFQGRSGNGSVGKGAHPSLPTQGTYVDDALKVTYWQQSMDDAVTW